MMKRAKRPTVDHTQGFVQNGRVILFSDIDGGRILLGTTTHRNGADHEPITGNRCFGCICRYRTDVLGHTIPTPRPFGEWKNDATS
jgi:hypothetical protein